MTMKAKHVLALLVGIMATSLFVTGCGDGDSSGGGASILGTWTWSKLVVNGITLDLNNKSQPLTPGGSTTITPQWMAQVATSQGTPGASIALTTTFNSDNTVTGSLVGSAPGEQPLSVPTTGSWNAAGDRLTLTITIPKTSAQGYTVQKTTVTLTGTYNVTSSKLTISMSNADIMQVLNANNADVSQLPPAYQQLLNSLSGSVEFTR
jgi:hypothetical protein